MRDETVQDVMAVLPDPFGYDQRRIVRNFTKNFHPIFLALDKKPCFLTGSKGRARCTCVPSLSIAAMSCFSMAAWAALHF
jgi:hypothetical protein